MEIDFAETVIGVQSQFPASFHAPAFSFAALKQTQFHRFGFGVYFRGYRNGRFLIRLRRKTPILHAGREAGLSCADADRES